MPKEKAARLAGGFNKISDAQVPNQKINRAEAVWANRQAAGIYARLGDDKKAAERMMMARYYQVDDKERNSIEFKFGRAPDLGLPTVKVIPRLRDGEFSIGAPTGKTAANEPPTAPPQKDLAEAPYKAESRKYVKTYKVVETKWRNGKPATQTREGVVVEDRRNFQMEGSLVSEGNKPVDIYESNNKKGRLTERKIVGYETYRSPELNLDGRGRATIAAGYVAFIEDWNKWMNFNIQGDLATKKLAAQDKARVEVFLRDNYPQPRSRKICRV